MRPLTRPRAVDARALALSLALTLTFFAAPARADDAARASCIAASETGQRLKLAHQLTEARAEMLACTRAACPAVIRRDCEMELAAVEESTPTVVLRAVDEADNDVLDVHATVDGAPIAFNLDGRATLVDPGVHTFHFEARQRAPVELGVLLIEGEKNRKLTVVMPRLRTATPAPVPEGGHDGVPVATWILGGVAVGAFGVGAYFGLSALDGRSTLRGGCGVDRACSDDAVSDVKRDALVADVALVTGLVAGAAAAWLFFSSRPSGVRASPSAAHSGPSFGLLRTTF